MVVLLLPGCGAVVVGAAVVGAAVVGAMVGVGVTTGEGFNPELTET